jgi:hypothetical protein
MIEQGLHHCDPLTVITFRKRVVHVELFADIDVAFLDANHGV